MLNRGWKLPWQASKKMSSKSLRSLENYMSKAAKKNRRMMERLDIEDWPLAPSLGSGHSQMIPRYEESNSQTDCSWLNWEK